MTDDLKKVLKRNLRQCLKSRDFGQARDLLEELRVRDPLSVETRGLELELLLYQEQFQEAEGLAEQLIHMFPTSPRIHYLAGRLAYRLRRYDVAERHFRESHRLHPQWFSLLFLGKTLTQNGAFEEAEAILSGLARDHGSVRCDLSWLYERQGQLPLAMKELEAYLRDFPNDEFALKQQQRLRSQSMDPSDVVSEIHTLQELGEEVDENLIPEYIDGLLRTGNAARARSDIEKTLPKLSSTIAVRAGWNCYRLQAYDLAFQLFSHALSDNLRNPKFLTAFETSARRGGDLADVIRQYERFTDRDPRMHGRIRRLSRHVERES